MALDSPFGNENVWIEFGRRLWFVYLHMYSAFNLLDISNHDDQLELMCVLRTKHIRIPTRSHRKWKRYYTELLNLKA